MSGLPSLILPIAALLKINYDLIYFDSMIWKLHYIFTTLFCLGSSAILSANDIVGNAISCISTEIDIPRDFLNLDCWMSYNFTLKGLYYILFTI